MDKTKLLLSLFFLINTIFSYAQLEVNIIDVTTNDLVYDAITNKIYASIPSSNGANGNSIGIININTFQLEDTVFIGSEPSVLAISDNGQYIYCGFNGSATIRRFNITDQTASIQFALGNDSSTGSFYAEDIEVMPNNANTIAVSRKNLGFSPRHEGVAIYDDNIMRPNSTQDHTGSNKIEFTSNNTLIGYNNETTEFGIRTLATNASGISETEVTNNILSGFGIDFTYFNNRIYGTNGQVIDVTSTPFVSGQFTNTNGPVTYDSYLDKVCYASSNGINAISFKRFNPNNFLIEDDLMITEATGEAKNIITCGNGCYAFNSENNKVVIIKDTSLGIDDIELNSALKIYPNPTTDYITVSTKNEIEQLLVININGQIIKKVSHVIKDKINLSGLNSGLYIIKIIFSEGEIKMRKIIKS